MNALKEECQQLRDELIALRREFHRAPELGLHEYHTAARIERELDRCGIPHERVGETAVAVPLGVGLIVRILARKGVDEPAHVLALGLLILLVAHHARGALSGAKRHVADGLREDLARHLDAQKIGQTLRPGTEVLAASCAAVRSATGHVPSPIVQLSLSALRPVKRSVQSAAVEFTVSESFSGVISSAFVSVRTMS